MAKKVLANFAESADLVEKLKFYEMNIDEHERLFAWQTFLC